MYAILRSARIAPKKANLVATMVRGMRAADAVEALRRTHKKGARLIEKLLLSAMANARHNEGQDAQTLIIRTLTVSKAQTMRRGIPMARGRVRPIRKMLSHITITLGIDGEEDAKGGKSRKRKNDETPENASQKAKKTVKGGGTASSEKRAKGARAKRTASSSASSASSAS